MELTKVLALHLTILLSVASWTRAVCCPKAGVTFYTVFDCAHFFAENSGELCFRDKACPNGHLVTHGDFCGVGKCNKSGCECEGGCLGGNTQEEHFAAIEKTCNGMCVAVPNKVHGKNATDTQIPNNSEKIESEEEEWKSKENPDELPKVFDSNEFPDHTDTYSKENTDHT